MSFSKKHNYLLLGFALVFYVFCRGSEPALGDAMSFTVSALQGFDWGTNATNHLAYINLLHVLSWPFSTGAAHSIFQLLSVFSAVAVLWFLQRCLRLIGAEESLIFIAQLFILFSFTFWRHALIVEVYAFNLLLVSAIWFCYLKWYQKRSNSLILWAAFLLGFAHLVHIQNILLLPFAAYWLYQSFGFRLSKWLLPLGIFCLPVSLLFILPAIHHQNSMSSVFFDNSFQDEVLQFGLKESLKGLLKSVAFVFFNFGLLPILVLVFAGKKYFKTNHFWAALIFALPTYLFAARYTVSDNYVFFLPAYFVLIFLCFSSFKQGIMQKARVWLLLLLFSSFLQPAFYKTAVWLGTQTSAGQKINSEKAYKGGLKFFLWPPMHGKPGGEFLARQLESGKLEEDENLEISQNADNAMKYLELLQQSAD